MKRHRLLEKQIAKYLAEGQSLPKEFIDAVNAAYEDFDADRKMVERSMEISSKEILAANQEMRSQNSELEALFRITQLLHGKTEMKSIFYIVAEEITHASGFPLICFEIFDPATASLKVQCMIGPESVVGPNLEAETALEGTFGALLASGLEAFVCEDARGSQVCSPLWRRINARNLISVPMIAGPTFWGTLTIAQFDGDQKPVRNLSSWLQTVAGQVASGLERLRLSKLSKEQAAAALADSKMSELGKMAGGIAHEINTPLGTILLLADDLSEQAQEQNLPNVAPVAEQIIKTVNRIATIVKGLRTFSRDGSNDPFLETSVAQMIKETVALCGERFRQNLVDLRFDVSSDVTIKCRETQISQMLLNMLNNSFDAVHDSENSWIQISVRELSDTIELSVTDSGTGIPEEIRDKLALPFFTTKSVGHGTGLGLSIATGIAKDHGGKIVIDSDSLNTRFVVTLSKDPETLSRARAG